MAETRFGINDALTVKLWEKTLDAEVPKFTDIMPLIGEDENAIIQRKTMTQKGPGDTITYGLVMQLSQDGLSEFDKTEGNGEELTRFSDAITINELGALVTVRSKNSIDAQRVPFDLRQTARDRAAEWYGTRYGVSFFNQVCGYTAETRTKYTGLQAVTAPSSTRIIRASSRANDESLVAGDTFNLTLVDKAVEMANTATPKIRPVRIGGENVFVMYLHDWQVTDLRTSTATGQWLDIQKAAMMGGQITNNAIYSGALGRYNDVILRKSIQVTPGVRSDTGASIATVRRAVLLGAQSAAIAFGQQNGPNRYRWNEELFDAKRSLEVSAWSIWGLKKITFNSTDFGCIVVPTYAAAHT